MADNDASEKTEDPTQKRLDDAHDRGDVAKSQEINTWFVIAGATLILSTFSASIGGGILMPLRNLIANSWMLHADGPRLPGAGQSLAYALIARLGLSGRANISSRNSARSRPGPGSSGSSASRRWRTSPRASLRGWRWVR